jgi:hypothetical protein
MREKIREDENWVIQKDDHQKRIIISYFEDGHFREELFIPYDELRKAIED